MLGMDSNVEIYRLTLALAFKCTPCFMSIMIFIMNALMKVSDHPKKFL